MEKITFKTILGSEIILNNLLDKLSINIENNRIHQSYALLRGFENVRLDSQEAPKYLKKYNTNGEIYDSLFDLNAIYNVLPFLEAENENILKIKMKKILRGTSLSLETDKDSEPRNTLFELLMLSYFRKVGLNAHLGDLNPDLEVEVDSRIYYLECKRVFRPTDLSVERNVNQAFEQLQGSLKDKPDNYFGVIALSVEPKQGKGYLGNSEREALEYLKNDLRNFSDRYGKYWRNEKFGENQNIIGIILHHLLPSRLTEETVRLSNGSFITITDTPSPLFGILAKDFGPLAKLQTEPSP